METILLASFIWLVKILFMIVVWFRLRFFRGHNGDFDTASSLAEIYWDIGG